MPQQAALVAYEVIKNFTFNDATLKLANKLQKIQLDLSSASRLAKITNYLKGFEGSARGSFLTHFGRLAKKPIFYVADDTLGV